MALQAGSRLGPYELLAPLGAGGMGEVYRARDRKLDRDVAIKVLPESVAADPAALARFEREAKAVAALSHPNILSIFDFGTYDGISYAVMELLEGETLREKLDDGPTGEKQAVDYALQIVRGLSAAHEQGVIHRDLKPENLFVTKGGHIKILDFGLAKRVDVIAPDEETRAPTVSSHTEPGTVMGTTAYMSPEQVCGLPADPRSDIFSFGAVLFELLSGKRAFKRDSGAETISAILNEEAPDLSASGRNISPTLDHIVRHCLEKDRSNRFQSAKDIAFALSELGTAGEQGRAMSSVARHGGSNVLRTAAVAIAAAAGFLTGRLGHRESPEPRAVARFSIDLPPRPSLSGSLDTDVAISPDGTRLAWAVGAEDRVIRFRRLDERDAALIAGTEGARSPFFSPDGNSIGFFSGGKLKRISLAGGKSVTLCDVEEPTGASWGPDGQIYFARERSPIWRVPAAGGVARAFTTLADGELAHTLPETLPASKALVFTVIKASDFAIAVLTPGAQDKRILMENAWGARYATGHLVFERREGIVGALLAAPFDVRNLRWTGDPIPVLEGISLVTPTLGHNFALSRNGTLFYEQSAPWFGNGVLVRVDRRGSEKRLTDVARAFYGPQLSPEGKRLAVGIGPDPDKSDVWIYEVERKILTRLTHDENSGFPVWTPDGGRLCFDTVVMKSRFNIFCQKADGSAEAEPLLKSPFSQWPYSISPDGAWLAFSELNPQTKGDMWLFPLARGGQPKLLLATPYNEWGAYFSPDGRWLAYSSDESGRSEIYVEAFPGPSRGWQLSVNGGNEPAWSRDGRELFYRQGDKMMSVALGGSSAFKSGTPTVLFQGNYAAGLPGWPNYCVTTDGQAFVMIEPVDSGPLYQGRLEVVLNWTEEMKRLRSGAHPR